MAKKLKPRDLSAEDACEQFIAAEIDSAPDALRRLGDWLSNVLDEDDNKTAARMVLGAMLETSAAVRNASAVPVVADEMVERACAAAARIDSIDWHNDEWQSTHKIEVGRLRHRTRAALTAALTPQPIEVRSHE